MGVDGWGWYPVGHLLEKNMAILIIREGVNQGATFRLGERNLTVGRGPNNLVQLVEGGVSRRHAAIRWTGQEYRITDLQSHNGVYVNGDKVHEAPLAMGDRIQIGETHLEVTTDAQLVSDGVLDRRVVEPAIVAAETQRMAAPGKQRPVQEMIDKGEVIDVDDLSVGRKLEQARWLSSFQRVVRKGDPQATVRFALDGIQQFVHPDRCMVIRVLEGDKVGKLDAWVSEDIPLEFHTERPYIPAISAAMAQHKSIIRNELPPNANLGTAAAVPVHGEDNTVVGVVYMDSFAENLQAYVEDDLFLLCEVSALIPEIVTSYPLKKA
jgi:hypothetical protein